MSEEFDCGGIYWVSFEPSIGHEFQGRRPAVVVQSDRQLRKSNLVTIMPLSSRTTKSHGDDILVCANHDNNLFADSLIKVHHIESFDRSRFLKKIGSVRETDMKAIRKYLKIHFDL